MNEILAITAVYTGLATPIDVEVLDVIENAVKVKAEQGHPFVMELARDDPEAFAGWHAFNVRWVDRSQLTSIVPVYAPDDLPIPADPAADAPVDVTDEMDADLTRVHLQAVYEGAA